MNKLVPFFTSFQGRIPREHFWLGFGVVLFASLITGLIPVIGSVVGLALLWPQFAIHAKRLHDMGHSGWLTLVSFSVSFGLLSLAMAYGGRAIVTARPGQTPPLFQPGLETPSWLFVAAVAVSLGFLIWVGSTPGQKEANKYGPPTS